MKVSCRQLFLTLMFIASGMLANATPDYQESTTESLLGANSEAYAVRRIESNNQGNYYRSQEKTFIDEYDNTTGKLIKSTLLLDKMFLIDAEHSDPNSSPKVSIEINYKDKELRLADMYEKYPPLHSSWKPDWLNEIKYTDNGIVFRGYNLISTNTIEKLYKLTFNHGKAEPKILSIQYRRDTIYFTITTRRSEDGISNKVICLSPQKTMQLNAWAAMQPIYLQVSSHDSLEAANLEALKIQKTLREAKIHSYHNSQFEIWSKRLQTDKMAYIIVLTASTYIIDSNRVEKSSKVLNVPLIPISNKGFRDRWVPNEKLSGK